MLINREKPMLGFGLIELMITISLLGILTTVAVDSFGTWIQNTKTRSMAESIKDGISLAQNEAIKQSRNTTFNLIGNAWNIQVMLRGGASTGADTSIGQSGVIHNGALPDASFVTISEANRISQIRFNSIGRLLSPSNTVNFMLSNTKGNRQMQVSVNVAGKIRMCDPDKILSASNPDGVDPDGNC